MYILEKYYHYFLVGFTIVQRNSSVQNVRLYNLPEFNKRINYSRIPDANVFCLTENGR